MANVRAAALVTMCVSVWCSLNDSPYVHRADCKSQPTDMLTTHPIGMEQTDTVEFLQVHKHHATQSPYHKYHATQSPYQCEPPPDKCNIESSFADWALFEKGEANKSLSILLRGEPFRSGKHGASSLDFTNFSLSEQKLASQSHVTNLIKPFENLGFKVRVMGVISEKVMTSSPKTAIESLEEIYDPWLHHGFQRVDSHNQAENWRFAWRELFRSGVRDPTLVIRFDVILKTDIAKLIAQRVQDHPLKMWVPFIEDPQHTPVPMSDQFQWVPPGLQHCLSKHFPDHLCGFSKCSKLIGSEFIGGLWQNPGTFPACPISSANSDKFPNALYRLAGRQEGVNVPNISGCPFLSSS